MAERRNLIEGLKPTIAKVDPQLEKAFVFGAKEPIEEPQAPPIESKQSTFSRSPLSTRVRSDLATALKRASLERQLENRHPNSLQDILEDALEAWLKTQGHL